MTVEPTDVTIIGNRVHVKTSNNIRAACHLQQEFGAWVLCCIPTLSILLNSHSCSFIRVHLELQGSL